MPSPAASPSRIREVLDLALERPAAEREAFVAGACAGDHALQGEVLSLLTALDAAGDLLEPPAAPPPAEPLTGLTFGAYTVRERIGAGGMGVVYEARDSRLGRTVAVKALPPSFAADPHRRARFEQEARTLAAINHPNIASIYGIEDTPRGRVMVLEHIPGRTLAELIAEGPIPPAEAIQPALQIARALEAAHAVGIIHRDLKPANIRITPDGVLKVLDFGISKTIPPPALPARDRTAATQHTRAGDILGTAAYMSPEQARGQGVDRRADLWAFGCILFEMLSGRRAFPGETSSDTIAALLRAEPDWTALKGGTPPALGRLLRRCLAKDPDLRLRDAGDARLELEDALDELTRPAPRPRAGRFRIAVLPAFGLAALAGAAVLAARRSPSPAPPPMVTRLALPIPGNATISANCPAIAVGSGAIAVAAGVGVSTQLYVRTPEAIDLAPVPGTDDAEAPFLSADGRWFAYFNSDTGALHKVSVNGGTPVVVAQADLNAYGGLWLRDGTIIYSVRWLDALYQIRPGNAAGEVLAPGKADESVYATAEVPGGEWLLVTFATSKTGGVSRSVELLNRRTRERRLLIGRGSDARLLPDGALVFARDGGLVGVRFDARTLSLVGAPVPLTHPVSMWSSTGPAYAAVSPDGSLAFAPGPIRVSQGELAWVSREGEVETILTDARAFQDPVVSPDGSRIAVGIHDQNIDLCTIDLTRPVPAPLRLTTGLHCYYPVWSPDSRSIYFFATHADRAKTGLYRVPADGAGAPEFILPGLTERPFSISPDGTLMLFRTVREKSTDLLLLSLTDGSVRDFLATPADEIWGVFSPDGRTVAYVATEFGRAEVFLHPFPGPGAPVRISTSGGYRPRWNPDGSELFFQYQDQMWSVPIDLSQSPPAAGQPRMLFEGRYITRHDVHPDGERFVAPLDTGRDAPLDRLYVVVNWSEEVRRRLGR